MVGLILLSTVIVCIAVLIALSRLLTHVLPVSRGLKALLQAVFVIAAFPLSIADEIIGKYQFEALCKTNGIESADISKAKGKRVKGKESNRTTVESGVLLPTKQSDITFRDADTGEVLIRHKSYYSEGGWLMRYTWISLGSNHPMLFDGNGCGWESLSQFFSTHQITLIN